MNEKIVNLSEENFDTVTGQNDVPVLVDFWAEWCAPCRRQGAVLDGLVDKLDSKGVVAKVNVDDNPKIAAKFGIMSIPTLMLFKNGEILDKMVGLTDEEELLSVMNEYMK